MLAARLNASTRRWPALHFVASSAAGGLAATEVVLMLVLGMRGQRGVVLRMLGSVGTVYVASDLLGCIWQRERPFSQRDEIHGLISHRPGRSFPSRHVASALAMASIARCANPRLGGLMAWLAWLLGLSRVAVGVHYPSDVLAGALLGTFVGRWLR